MARTSVNTWKITHFSLLLGFKTLTRCTIQFSMARPLLHQDCLTEASHICHTRPGVTTLHVHSITVRASHLTTRPFFLTSSGLRWEYGSETVLNSSDIELSLLSLPGNGVNLLSATSSIPIIDHTSGVIKATFGWTPQFRCRSVEHQFLHH